MKNLRITIGDERGYVVVNTSQERMANVLVKEDVSIIKSLLIYNPRKGDTVETRVAGIDYIVEVG